MQPEVEDGLCLHLGQTIAVRGQAGFLGKTVGTDGDGARPGQHLRHHARFPAPGHQARLCVGRSGGCADQRDHLVDIRESDRESFQDVAALPGLAQLEHRAPGDDLAPVADEGLQQFLEVQQARLTVLQRDDVDAEHRLHRRLLVEIVEHDVGDFAALELDDDTHAVLVRLVPELGNALDLLAAHEVRDALEQPRLVDLIRQLGDDDRLAAGGVDFLDVGLGPDQEPAPTRGVSVVDLARAVDDPGRRKIRARHMLHEFRDADVRVVDDRHTGVNHLGEVVRRDVRRHAHSDAGRAVHEQVRHAGRQHRRLDLGLVVVRREIDRFLVDVGEQLRRDPGHPDLGVTHRRRSVAVDRAEVALAVDEQVAHREGLGHAHDRVVHGRVAVGVILADHVTDDTGRLLVWLVPVVAELPHCVEDAAVDRLETVPNVGQGPAHDHAHGVIEVGLFHLVFEIDVQDFACDFGHGGLQSDTRDRSAKKTRNDSTKSRPDRPWQ